MDELMFVSRNYSVLAELVLAELGGSGLWIFHPRSLLFCSLKALRSQQEKLIKLNTYLSSHL